MKSLLLVLLGLQLTSSAVCPQSNAGWDADNNVPPPTSSLSPLRTPVPIKPFTLVVYQECESLSGKVQHNGKFSLRIFSEYAFAAFESEVGDTLVVLKIRAMSGAKQEKIYYPKKPFTLLVIILRAESVPDTAVFRMNLAEGTYEYAKRSKLVLTGTPQELPDNFVSIQFFDRDKNKPKTFLYELNEKFGGAAKGTVLAEGFYPCLPTECVDEAAIGRKNRDNVSMVNETAYGYLACVKIIDTSRTGEIMDWIALHQIDEYKRVAQSSSNRSHEK